MFLILVQHLEVLKPASGYHLKQRFSFTFLSQPQGKKLCNFTIWFANFFSQFLPWKSLSPFFLYLFAGYKEATFWKYETLNCLIFNQVPFYLHFHCLVARSSRTYLSPQTEYWKMAANYPEWKEIHQVTMTMIFEIWNF